MPLSILTSSLFHQRPPRQFALLASLIAFVVLAGCSSSQAAARHPFDAPTLVPPDTASAGVEIGLDGTATVSKVDGPVAITGEQWLYTGQVVPAGEIIIVTQVGGRIRKVDAKEGDSISAGQTLLALEATVLEAQRGQALAALQLAQAEAELLQTRATDAEIEAARATVAAAQEAYRRALEDPDEDLSTALAALRQAEVALRIAQATNDQTSWNPLISALPQNAELEQAKAALAAAQARYDALANGTSEVEIAERYAQLASARAQLQRLEDGPTEAEIQASQTKIRLAETALYLAQLELEKAVVAAPVDGIVAEVYVAVGATALPGAPAMRLISPTVKIVIAVEANRLAYLHVGQSVRVQLNAYPNETIEGTLTAIAPELEPETGTARVTIEPVGETSLLKPGMIATVEILQQ